MSAHDCSACISSASGGDRAGRAGSAGATPEEANPLGQSPSWESGTTQSCQEEWEGLCSLDRGHGRQAALLRAIKERGGTAKGSGPCSAAH